MSEQEKTPPVFVDGLNIKLPSEKAPAWILLQMGFNAQKFFRWCQDHMDDKGWVNITVKKSQKGVIYGELDTWKPNKESVEPSPITLDDLNPMDTTQSVEDIPF